MKARLGAAGKWLVACVKRAPGASLFWLFTVAAIAILGMVAIAIGAILRAGDLPDGVASLLGTALALMGYTARDVVGAIRALLGDPGNDAGENGG